MRVRAVVLALAIVLAPLEAKAADLMVWWEKGFNPEEDAAVREMVAAFEQETGTKVELVFHPQAELPNKIVGALKSGEPPDFAFGYWLSEFIGDWSFDDQLVDLTATVGSFSNLFDPEQLDQAIRRNARTGHKALYGLPMGQMTNHIHVWKSLLERAGFTLDAVPKEWDPFWSFWCDRVQPAVRRATGRDDIWGVGLSMSADASDPETEFFQFVDAYQAHYVTPDGRLVIDDPEVRRKLILAMDSYTTIYRRGCTPPDSVTWANIDNNKAFLAQTVVMTANDSLSIPNALKHERPEDYYQNTATIEWPLGPSGEPFPIQGSTHQALAFRHGAHVATAKEFVRFLVAEGWLAHYLDFSGERILPSMPKLLDSPFWLDPRDPHHMAAVMQVSSRPKAQDYDIASGDPRHDRITNERVWGKAIHRVAAEGISPEQAIDDAIARIKQILAE